MWKNNGIPTINHQILNLDNSLQKKKKYLTLYYNATRNSLWWIYQSAKSDWTKKPFEYIAPPPPQVGRNKKEKYYFRNTIAWKWS